MKKKRSLDKFWDAVAPRLRKALGLQPLTMKEADEAMRTAEEVPISEDEIYRIVDDVCRKEARG